MSEAGVSVIICCHNSASRLPETLKHLAKQRLPDSIPWEVVLVNNASGDETASVASLLWTAEHLPTPFRIVDEPILGLSHARECGIANSRYDTIIFVDDDNWLAEDYLCIASDVMGENPSIGALGGYMAARYEKPPPAWFEEVQANFAIGPQARTSGDITDEKPFLAGAGMALRKSAYENLRGVGFNFLLSDRKGTETTTGGDTELCYALALRGYRMWYDDRLRLEHFMPAQRLTTGAVFDLNRNINKAAIYCSLYAMVLKGEQGSLRWYFRDLIRVGWWCIKSVAKFMLGQRHMIGVGLEFQSLAVWIAEFPSFMRAVREHYCTISRLRSPAKA